MITFKPVVYAHQRRRDGSYNVKIKITYKRAARHLPTNVFVNAGDLTRSLKIKNPDIISKCNYLCDQMRGAVGQLSLFELEAHDVEWVVNFIKRSLSEEVFRLDFFDYAEKFIATKSPQNGRVYRSAVNAFAAFLGARSIDVNDVTSDLVQAFKTALKSQRKQRYNRWTKEVEECNQPRKNEGQVVRTLTYLSAIFNAAKEEYNDPDAEKPRIPRQPFMNKIDTMPNAEGQKNLGVDVMNALLRVQPSREAGRVALDAFIVSFGLMGMNMADLWKQKQFQGDTVAYERKKTRGRRRDKAFMNVAIPEQIKPYLSRLQQGEGDWWLPALHRYQEDRATGGVNAALRKIQKGAALPDFTFYAARHTWASLARKAGVDKGTIDECLAHIGDFDMANIYAERDWDVINEANRKTLALLDWPTKE